MQSAFRPHVADELLQQAVASTPAKAGVPEDVRGRAADSSIKWHRAGLSATSAAVGLPGGWWLAGTMPTDLTQYFWHVIVLSQKLAYLYGLEASLPVAASDSMVMVRRYRRRVRWRVANAWRSAPEALPVEPQES